MKRLTTLSLIAVMAALAGSPSYAQYQQPFQGNNYGNGHHGYGPGYGTHFGGGTSFNAGYGSGLGMGFGTGYGFNFRNIDNLQAQLQTRINRGISSGRLNRKEAAKLNGKMAQIATVEARMRATGNKLTAHERTRLLNHLTQLNNEITRELNDFERRRVGFWGNNNRWR